MSGPIQHSKSAGAASSAPYGLYFSLILLAGLLGLFGRGPLNQVTRKLPDGTKLTYERVVRFKSPTAVQLVVPVDHGMARIEADKAAVAKLGFQRVVPATPESLGSDRVVLQFQPLTPDVKSIFVELSMQPATIGPVASTYVINGDTEVRTAQFAVP